MGFKSLYEMKWRTDMSSLINESLFGVRFSLNGRKDKETMELLQKGIRVCDILSKVAEVGQKEKITLKELEYSIASHPLKEASRNLEFIEKDSKKTLGILNLMFNGQETSEEEVKYARNFLRDVGEVYQHSSWRIFSKLREGSCF